MHKNIHQQNTISKNRIGKKKKKSDLSMAKEENCNNKAQPLTHTILHCVTYNFLKKKKKTTFVNSVLLSFLLVTIL